MGGTNAINHCDFCRFRQRANFTLALRAADKVPACVWGRPRRSVGRWQEEILPKTRMSQTASVIEELEDVLAAGSSDRRTEILRRVTDLFLGNAENFNHEQVGVFDDVLAHLIHQVETNALAELGSRLAPIGNAPSGIIRTLSRHDEISVAGPVLAQSPQLTDGDLVEIAGLKGQGHLGAISERKRLAAAVTDILIQRGDTTVVRKLSQNQGATFSERWLRNACDACRDRRTARGKSRRPPGHAAAAASELDVKGDRGGADTLAFGCASRRPGCNPAGLGVGLRQGSA